MDNAAIARGSSQDERRSETRQEPRPDARWPSQSRMVSAARIAFDSAVLDCALMEATRGGARVHLMDPAAVPEIAVLRLGCGASWTVRRQWQQGAQVGFSVVGPAPT